MRDIHVIVLEALSDAEERLQEFARLRQLAEGREQITFQLLAKSRDDIQRSRAHLAKLAEHRALAISGIGAGSAPESVSTRTPSLLS